MEVWIQRTITGDLDIVPKLPSLSLHLDAVMKELLEVRTVKDTIGSWLGVIDNELMLSSRGFGSGGLGLEIQTTRCEPTEKGTQQSDTEDD